MRYWIDAADRLADFDDEWCRFARDNGAETIADRGVLGQPLNRFIADPTTRAIWRRLLGRVRSGRRFSLEIRCDGPDRRRLLRLTPSLESAGSVRIDSELLSETRRPSLLLGDTRATPQSPRLVSCSWCNRFEVRTGHWVEAEEMIDHLDPMSQSPVPAITHGVCESCAGRLEATG